MFVHAVDRYKTRNVVVTHNLLMHLKATKTKTLCTQWASRTLVTISMAAAAPAHVYRSMIEVIIKL